MAEKKWHFTDEQVQEFKCDGRKYAEELLYIQKENGELGLIEYIDAQKIYLEILDDIYKQGRPRWVVVLKGRRQYISTGTASLFFHRTATRDNHYTMIVSHEPDSSEFLYNMYRRFYTHLHPEMKPSTKYNSKRILEFNRPDGTGLDSAIRVATAGKEDVGSSQMIHSLHLSEVAKWPKHTAGPIFTSIMPCIPQNADSCVVVESTAKGWGGEFHNMFRNCRYAYEVYIDKDRSLKFRQTINEQVPESNQWTSIFIPWFASKKYAIGHHKEDDKFEMTDEERELAKTHNLHWTQINWYRHCLETICGGSKTRQLQEFPSTPRDAFQSSGDPVFPMEVLDRLFDTLPDPKARYECQISTGQFVAEKQGRFKVWEEPEPGRHYIVSADVAEGLEKGDASVIDVIDHLTGAQVAQWYGKIAPDIFGEVMAAVGKRYNMAWLVPERNNHGNTVVLKLYDMGYPKLYVEKVPDPPNKPRKRYGWVTSRTTKPQIIDNLAAEVREGAHGIKCKDTVREMMSYQRGPDGEMEAAEGELDDRVISYAIAKFIRTRLPLPGMQRQNNTGWEKPAAKRKTPNMRAWS